MGYSIFSFFLLAENEITQNTPYCHPQDICKEEAAGLFDSLLAPAEEEYYDTLQD